jgi:hypothetical protein
VLDDSPPDETIELTEDRWIALAFSREWPRYVVEWSVRRRVGESDFPLLRGRVVREPESGGSGHEIWCEARDQAVEEANGALDQQVSEQPDGSKGLLSRLFRR